MRFHAIGEVFLSLCESVDTPISLAMWLRYKYSQEDFARCRINPRNYNDAQSFRNDYLIFSFLKKFKGLDTGIDTKGSAIQKFIASEGQCLATNRRLRSFTEGLVPRSEAIMHSALRKVSAILGPLDKRQVLLRCEWTKGATYDIPKRSAFVDHKMTSLPMSVTRQALPWARLLIETDPRWYSSLTGFYPEGPYSLLPTCFKLVEGNRVTTVPKDSTTDRIIAVEPTANIFLQKGVGNYIRRRLKKFGVDLSKQSTNQYWAWKAQDLGLATIDLSSASDTIAKELVFQLLPVDWAEYLNDIRSPFGTLPDGRSIRYEKFSSMGNGFTFELESLIFFALCEAYQETFRSKVDWKMTSVYGDDIIVPKWCYHGLVDWLSDCGFSVNPEKSFSDGYFYESCGKHYFDGEDVTPVYQKELLDEVEAMRCGNRLVRWCFSHDSQAAMGGWHVLRDRFRSLSFCLLPVDAEGDDGWISPFFTAKYDRNAGFKCRVIRFKKKRFPFHDEALLAYSLRKMSWTSPFSAWIEESSSPRDTSFAERLGFLFAELTDELIVEVESSRFTFGWRWVHTSLEEA